MPTLKRKLILPMHLVMRRNPVPVDHRVRRRLGAQSNRKWARPVFLLLFACFPSVWLCLTASLRVVDEWTVLQAKFRPAPIYISNPTWGNHVSVFEAAGLSVRQYRYFHP